MHILIIPGCDESESCTDGNFLLAAFNEKTNEVTMNSECMLTTFDNPYNPFVNFGEWFMFDSVEKGYNSCSRLARVANVTDDMSEVEYNREVERAIDEIILHDFMNIYKKVRKNDIKVDVNEAELI